MSVGVFAESATEWSCRINISCTAGPNMYSPSVLVFISTICAPLSPSSFPLQGSPKLDPAHGFQRMSVPVWSAALLFGELPPGEGGGRKKKTGFGSKKKPKKKQLFIWGRKETATPCGKQMHAVSSLSWQALELPTKKIMKVYVGTCHFEGSLGPVVREEKREVKSEQKDIIQNICKYMFVFATNSSFIFSYWGVQSMLHLNHIQDWCDVSLLKRWTPMFWLMMKLTTGI